MRRILDFFRSWATAAGVVRHVLSLRSRLVRLERDTSRLMASFAKRQRGLVRLQESLDDETERVMKVNHDAEAMVKRYEDELEAVRSKLQIAEESTIPALIAAHKMQHERWKAEEAIHVRRGLRARTEEER